jgi:hypothetical protein
MRNLVIVALILFGTNASFAEDVHYKGAVYHFDDQHRFASFFDRTLIFGHSISSNLRSYFHWIPADGYFATYGEGPATVLSRIYAGKEPLVNISEGAGFPGPESGLDKMSRWVNNEQYVKEWHSLEGDGVLSKTGDAFVQAGSMAWNKVRTGRDINKMNQWFEQSSAIVSVDALYLVDRFNQCSDYGAQGLRDTISGFIDKAYQANKVLIIGNVPKEDPNTITWLANTILPPQNEYCRKMVNRALEACTTEKNCYLVNLESIVNTINTTGKWTLQDGTVLLAKNSAGKNEIRPDGVNMTPGGTQILVEDILRRLSANPPHPISKSQQLQ